MLGICEKFGESDSECLSSVFLQFWIPIAIGKGVCVCKCIDPSRNTMYWARSKQMFLEQEKGRNQTLWAESNV